jgi:pilus assembly protein CpaF
MYSLAERLNLGTEHPTQEQAPVAPAAPRAAGIIDPFDPLMQVKTDIHREIVHKLGVELTTHNHDNLLDLVHGEVAHHLGALSQPLGTHDRSRLTQSLIDDILAYGPITEFLNDESVTEVMVNGWDLIYIERAGKIVRTHASFIDNDHLERIIQKIVSEVGRRVDESSPMVDARLPDGSRVNAILPPLSVGRACLTIRKFRRDPFTMDELIKSGTLTPPAAQFLQCCVHGAANILIVGGTGSGKTTMLNVLSSSIPDDQRIITVEDAAELQLKQEHVITLESRPENNEGRGAVPIRDLVRNCLRMRPDRIVVGECRSAETVDMLQAMNTGHDGSMTTIHANSPREALSRIETLVLMAGVELPARAIREQIAGALDLVVQTERLVDGTRRVTNITEVVGMENDVVTMQDVFAARHEAETESNPNRALLGPLRPTGVVPRFLPKLGTNGVRVPTSIFSRGGKWLLDR